MPALRFYRGESSALSSLIDYYTVGLCLPTLYSGRSPQLVVLEQHRIHTALFPIGSEGIIGAVIDEMVEESRP